MNTITSLFTSQRANRRLEAEMERLSETERYQLIEEQMLAAGVRSAQQADVMKALHGVAFDGVFPDGTKVTRDTVRAKALLALRSEVPEQLLSKAVGAGDEEAKELRISLVLDASSDDPNVTVEMLEGMFTPGELPAPDP